MKKSNKWLMLSLTGLLLGACGGPEEPKDKPDNDPKQDVVKCPEGFTGANCDQCLDGYYGLKCKPCTCVHGECNDTTQGDGFCREESCEPGFTGKNCNKCANEIFTGENCDECFDSRFKGENCDQCANEIFTGENCDECFDNRFTGENCDKCSDITYGPDCTLFGSVTDRGGNTYKTVIINDQVWMAENMRYKSGTYYHVNDSANNDNAYGLLYTRVSAGSICPTDWRLPSKDDVDKLLAYVDENKTSTSVFLALIAKSPAWGDYESMAGDEFGFGALPNGYRSQNGSFSEFGQTAYWWLADEQNSTGTYIYTFKIDPSGGLSISSDNLNAGLAVRCVKDNH